MAKAVKKAAVAKPVNSVDVILTTQGMAAHLGVTPRWLQSLVKDGTIPSLGRGRFDPTAVVQSYITFLKEGSEKKTGTASLDELRREKAIEIRMNRARKERELIPTELAVGVLQEVVGMFNAYLTGLPAEITGVPRERQRLNDIIDLGKQRLADRCGEQIASVVSGTPVADPAAEDDAG